MCTNGVLFIQREKNPPKLKFINGIVLQYGSIMAIEKKTDSKNVSCINPITN